MITETTTTRKASCAVDAIVLYGSKAQGDDTPDSAIDLMVLTGRLLRPQGIGCVRPLEMRVELR